MYTTCRDCQTATQLVKVKYVKPDNTIGTKYVCNTCETAANKLLMDRVRAILEVMKQTVYSTPNNVTDGQAMGMLMARYFQWDGGEILVAAGEGLEDSNYHTEAAQCRQMAGIDQGV